LGLNPKSAPLGFMVEVATFDEGTVKPIVLGGRLMGFRVGTDEIRAGTVVSAPKIVSRGGKIIVSGGDPEMIKKNLDLHAEFMRYTFENPNVLDKMPKGSRLVILPDDHPQLHEQNLKIVKDSQEKKLPVVIVRMKTPTPIVPKIEIISSSN